jgi:hypothetical protein
MWFGTQAAFSLAVQKAVQAAIGPQLTRIETAVNNLLKGFATMPQTLDDILAEVTRNTSVEQSAVTLIQGLAAQLQAALNSGDTTKIQAIITQLKANDDQLAAAVTANTTPPPPPPPAPPSS